jgi:hypothetical protein
MLCGNDVIQSQRCDIGGKRTNIDIADPAAPSFLFSTILPLTATLEPDFIIGFVLKPTKDPLVCGKSRVTDSNQNSACN